VGKSSKEKNIRLVIAYDGTGYYGWQRQLDKLTIQGTIEKKIELMVGKPVSLIASGRTDTGVHAIHQVANFRVFSTLTPSIFLKGLNSLLPHNIIIKEAGYAAFDFHARYDAKSKVYEYRIHNQALPSPFLRHYAWHISKPLDVDAMVECLAHITGIHDFTSFYSAGDGKLNPVRDMIRANLVSREGNVLNFSFEANGFLRHMVRNIMGTLVRVGLGEIDTARFVEILDLKDRQKAGAMAPPGGLYLTYVKY
jgi:tRNA pseudouridine38-40 synthase